MTTFLPAPVRVLVEAAGRGDTDAFLASFTPDGIVDDWGREFAGQDRIRGWSDREFIGVRASLLVTDVITGGSRVTVTAEVGGDGYTGPSHFAFDLDGDRVARMSIRA